MKIAYLDLNDEKHYEDYSINPRAYGGGAVFARWAKESFPRFHLYADALAFQNVSQEGEHRENCLALSHEDRARIREGVPVKDVIANAASYDLFVYHQPNLFLNLEGLTAKQCCWAIGYGEFIHPRIEHLLLYSRQFQHPQITGQNTKIYDVVIGKPFPEIKDEPREDFLFQCTRHTPIFGSIDVAQFCLASKITGVFAGPIDPSYRLMDYIDNVNTFYIGIISEQEKMDWTRRARLYTFIHKWNTPFNLSAIEALSVGTPIAATPVGFWGSLIANGYNGWLVRNADDLYAAWQGAKHISRQQVRDSALRYTHDNMIVKFTEAFTKILS